MPILTSSSGHRRRRSAALAPEARLLLSCLRPDAAGRLAQAVACFSRARGSWERFLKLAHRHALASLVAAELNAGDARVALPVEIGAALRSHFHATALNNQRLARELLRLLELCAAHGFAVLAFKGPLSAVELYGSLALREFEDLDILVGDGDLPALLKLLKADGYSAAPGLSAALGRRGPFQLSQAPFRKAGVPGVLDLHWELAPHYFPFAPAPAELFARARALALEGRAVPTLAPDDLLLFVSIHGAKHGWTSLSWICDLARLWQRHGERLDWRGLSGGAHWPGTRRMVFLGAMLAHRLLGAPLPGPLYLAARADPVAIFLYGAIKYGLFHSGRRLRLALTWLVPLCLILHMGARVRYLAGRALVPTLEDAAFVPLPQRLSTLYYLIRPVRRLLA